MIEFAFALPEDQRSRNAGKHIVRESLKGILPDEIRLRRDKASFSSVVAEPLVRADVLPVASFENLSRCGYVDPTDAGGKFERFRQLFLGGTDEYIGYDWPLWMAIVAESWLGAMSDGGLSLDGSLPLQQRTNRPLQPTCED
jgi:hypothetical protein